MGKVCEPISNKLWSMLKKSSYEVYCIEYTYKTKINVAQKGNKILINAGPKTGIFSMKDIKSQTDFMDFVYKMLSQNLKIKRGCGLNKYV